MNITFKNNPMTLEGSLLKVGDKVEFKATNTDFSEFDLNSLKGKKVISTFPSIDTSVCDLQTKKIADLANEYKDIEFISISLDLPSAQAKWCAATGNENIKIVSDYKDREFAKKYGLLIKELKLIHRSIIVLDENNLVTDILTKNEVTEDPDFDKLKEILAK